MVLVGMGGSSPYPWLFDSAFGLLVVVLKWFESGIRAPSRLIGSGIRAPSWLIGSEIRAPSRLIGSGIRAPSWLIGSAPHKSQSQSPRFASPTSSGSPEALLGRHGSK